jgi:hypothetical protein
MERASRRRSSSAGSEKMERDSDRQKEMEGHRSTGQGSQWAVVPMEEEEGAENETSAHILCECEALASLRHVYLGSSFLEPEDIQIISLGAIWNCSKGTGLP